VDLAGDRVLMGCEVDDADLAIAIVGQALAVRRPPRVLALGDDPDRPLPSARQTQIPLLR